MKKIVYFSLSALALFVFTFSSCEKSDDSSCEKSEDDAEAPEKRLVKVIKKSGDDYFCEQTINYDPQGQMISVSTQGKEGDYDFNSKRVYEHSYEKIKVTTLGGNGVSEYRIDSDYDIWEIIKEQNKESYEYDFDYRHSGELEDIEIHRRISNNLFATEDVYSYTWEGENIAQVANNKGYALLEYTNTDDTPTPKISKLSNYIFESWLFALDENVVPFKMSLSRDLPVYVKNSLWGDVEEYFYSWTLDADGYPTEVTKKTVGEEPRIEITTFIWE